MTSWYHNTHFLFFLFDCLFDLLHKYKLLLNMYAKKATLHILIFFFFLAIAPTKSFLLGGGGERQVKGWERGCSRYQLHFSKITFSSSDLLLKIGFTKQCSPISLLTKQHLITFVCSFPASICTFGFFLKTESMDQSDFGQTESHQGYQNLCKLSKFWEKTMICHVFLLLSGYFLLPKLCFCCFVWREFIDKIQLSSEFFWCHCDIEILKSFTYITCEKMPTFQSLQNP